MAAAFVANMEHSNVVTSSAKQGPPTEPKTMLNMATRLELLVFTINGNTSCLQCTIHDHASASCTAMQHSTSSCVTTMDQ